MTNSEMFKAAHAQAKQDCRMFSELSYREAFGNALRGFYAVRRGYVGVRLMEAKRVWA